MSYTVQVARVNVIGSNLVSYVVYAVGRATVKKYEASVSRIVLYQNEN